MNVEPAELARLAAYANRIYSLHARLLQAVGIIEGPRNANDPDSARRPLPTVQFTESQHDGFSMAVFELEEYTDSLGRLIRFIAEQNGIDDPLYVTDQEQQRSRLHQTIVQTILMPPLEDPKAREN